MDRKVFFENLMEFIKENSNGKDKESIFLLLTRSVDVKKEELNRFKDHSRPLSL